MNSSYEVPKTAIKDPCIANIMGWAEYPFIETALVAEANGFSNIASGLRTQGAIAATEAGKAWVADLDMDISRSHGNHPQSKSREDLSDTDMSKKEILGQLTIKLDTIRLLKLEADDLVREVREYGASWGDIGVAAGMRSTSAYTRWAKKIAQKDQTPSDR